MKARTSPPARTSYADAETMDEMTRGVVRKMNRLAEAAVRVMDGRERPGDRARIRATARDLEMEDASREHLKDMATRAQTRLTFEAPVAAREA